MRKKFKAKNWAALDITYSNPGIAQTALMTWMTSQDVIARIISGKIRSKKILIKLTHFAL